MSRGRDPRALQRALARLTGVAVDVRWDRSVASEHVPGRWAWHVSWADGPTVAGMRAAAEQSTAPGGTVAGGIEAGRLVYVRVLQPRAYALALIRHAGAGRPAAELASGLLLDGQLETQPYPDRGTDEEVDLADRLADLAGGLPHRMHAILTEHGPTAIPGAGPDANATVIPLPRRTGPGSPPAPARHATVVTLAPRRRAGRQPAGTR